MMFSKYILNDKLYPDVVTDVISDIRIECARYVIIDDKKIVDPKHEHIIISDSITVNNINAHELDFSYKEKNYIFWADMSGFIPRCFKTISQIRDEKLNKLL